jgi:hypothetical protein
MQLLEAAPPDEGGGGGSRSLMPFAKDADDVDADADDDDSSDEVGGCSVGAGWFGRGSGFRVKAVQPDR